MGIPAFYAIGVGIVNQKSAFPRLIDIERIGRAGIGNDAAVACLVDMSQKCPQRFHLANDLI